MTHLPFSTDAILESLNDGFQAFDREWRYAYLNQRAEQILGRKREELLGKVCWEEYPEAVGTEFHAHYLHAMESGEPVVFESFCPHEERWAEFSLHPYPGGLGALTRDITERKQAEEAVRRSQAELEDFFENSTVGLHWVDANGIIVRANRAELEMLGYAPEEYIGHSIAEFHADGNVIEDILCRLTTGQTLHDYHARLRCKDGSIRHVLISSSVLFEDGKFVHTRCFTRDITDRYIAEAERARAAEEARSAAETRKAAEALRESEERFRLLVEGVKDYAIFLLNTEGYITTWNTGAERAKGYKADEIIGQHFSRFYTPEDIARRHPWNELEIAKREGSYEEEGWRVRKDGSRFWANVLITALRDEEGRLRGFAKVTRDVTERRERERERVAAARADQQRRLLRDVLASVTEGRLMLCESAADLPERLPAIEGATNDPLPLTEQTLRLVRRRTVEAAEAAGLDKDRANGLLTAVGEATMNAVSHARDGMAYVGADPETGRVQVRVEDKGQGIDMSRLPQATLEHGYSTAGTLGHGFKMMLQTADRLWLLTGPTGTTVVLEQSREAPLPEWLGEVLAGGGGQTAKGK
jgi:PAS domain S-box-containing protein